MFCKVEKTENEQREESKRKEYSFSWKTREKITGDIKREEKRSEEKRRPETY